MKFLTIHLTKESCDLIVAALRKLPHEQVHELVVDIVAQAHKALDPAPDILVDEEPA